MYSVVKLRTKAAIAEATAFIIAGEDDTFGWLLETSNAVWGVFDEDGTLVGTAGASTLRGNLHLTICYVAPIARGKGVQTSLIKARLAWGKRQGAKVAYTYANRRNRGSLISLLKCGFNPYEVEGGFCYVAKYL